MSAPIANQLVLTARIAEVHALRYTPAGLPALDLLLAHESEAQEASETRQVKASIKAVVLGAMAETLSRQALGSQWRFSGFIANPKNAKNAVFHIQAFQQD